MDADLEPTWMYLRRVLSKALCFPASELTALLVKKMTLVILAKVIFFSVFKKVIRWNTNKVHCRRAKLLRW